MITNAAKQDLATAFGNYAVYCSLHTGDPGTTGGFELSGGSPAYARVSLTWTPGTNGTNTANATFNIPANVTITYAALWTAQTGGTMLGSAPLALSQNFIQQSNYTVAITYLQS